MTDKRWLSRRQAADYIGVDVTTLDRLRFQEGLPYSKIGKGNSPVRLDRDELDRWMKDRERTGAA